MIPCPIHSSVFAKAVTQLMPISYWNLLTPVYYATILPCYYATIILINRTLLGFPGLCACRGNQICSIVYLSEKREMFSTRFRLRRVLYSNSQPSRLHSTDSTQQPHFLIASANWNCDGSSLEV